MLNCEQRDAVEFSNRNANVIVDTSHFTSLLCIRDVQSSSESKIKHPGYVFEHLVRHMLGMVDCPVAPRWQCNWMVNLWICTFCYWWYRPNQTVYRSLPNHSLAISQSLPWILWQKNTRWLINSVEFDGKMINANRRTERKKNIFCLALAIHINGMLLMICNSRDSIVTIAMLSSYSFSMGFYVLH